VAKTGSCRSTISGSGCEVVAAIVAGAADDMPVATSSDVDATSCRATPWNGPVSLALDAGMPRMAAQLSASSDQHSIPQPNHPTSATALTIVASETVLRDSARPIPSLLGISPGSGQPASRDNTKGTPTTIAAIVTKETIADMSRRVRGSAVLAVMAAP
jgi:hypothetical protein